MESHGISWNPMEPHRIPRNLMKSHRTSWNPTEPHEIPRNQSVLTEANRGLTSYRMLRRQAYGVTLNIYHNSERKEGIFLTETMSKMFIEIVSKTLIATNIGTLIETVIKTSIETLIGTLISYNVPHG
jgi:hypothetical protein